MERARFCVPKKVPGISNQHLLLSKGFELMTKFLPGREPRNVNSMKAIASGVALAALVVGSGAAFAYSERVNNSCRGDYHRLCSAYAPGSTELRRCMESNRGAISKRCVDALVDAGEVPRKYLKGR